MELKLILTIAPFSRSVLILSRCDPIAYSFSKFFLSKKKQQKNGLINGYATVSIIKSESILSKMMPLLRLKDAQARCYHIVCISQFV